MTNKDLTAAVGELSAIPYFPQDSSARLAIAVQIGKFVEDGRRLRWLVDTAVNHMTEWNGIAGLRALYCVSYKPADGIEGIECAVQGFTPADCEAANTLPPVDFKKLKSEDQKAIEGLL